ncbi:hypothetical protein WR25_13698 [Diploscapter pachys]|uniref:Uncharacterized protein n=1 Tax=Diploscapter pachys TaxID=2018661 RepID=A0A2A2K7L0_9BILA|nr:hypothetical protein WR25_13698 [Diploscapter pachys]
MDTMRRPLTCAIGLIASMDPGVRRDDESGGQAVSTTNATSRPLAARWTPDQVRGDEEGEGGGKPCRPPGKYRQAVAARVAARPATG